MNPGLRLRLHGVRALCIALCAIAYSSCNFFSGGASQSLTNEEKLFSLDAAKPSSFVIAAFGLLLLVWHVIAIAISKRRGAAARPIRYAISVDLSSSLAVKVPVLCCACFALGALFACVPSLIDGLNLEARVGLWLVGCMAFCFHLSHALRAMCEKFFSASTADVMSTVLAWICLFCMAALPVFELFDDYLIEVAARPLFFGLFG